MTPNLENSSPSIKSSLADSALPIGAGLIQAAILLIALWAIKPGTQEHNLLGSAAWLGFSLLPIGFSLRLPWLRFAAIVWGILFLVQSGKGVGLPALLFIAVAAAIGQWLNLGLLAVGRVTGVMRWLARALIVLSVLLLFIYFSRSGSVVVAMALIIVPMADLALTALTLIIVGCATANTPRADRSHNGGISD